MHVKDAVGRYGENIAAQHLIEQGMRILDRNWRGESGEIDIVAADGDTIVFAEVKTRRTLDFGHPVEAVTDVKYQRLRRLAGQWLAQHPMSARDVRIDVIAVVRPRSGPARVVQLRGVTP